MSVFQNSPCSGHTSGLAEGPLGARARLRRVTGASQETISLLTCLSPDHGLSDVRDLDFL